MRQRQATILPLPLFTVNPIFEKSSLLQQSNYLHCPHKIEVETVNGRWREERRGEERRWLVGILQPVGNKIVPSRATAAETRCFIDCFLSSTFVAVIDGDI